MAMTNRLVREGDLVKHVRVTAEQIQEVMDRSEDAYSYDRYASWRACAAALLRKGFTPCQARAILLSKLTRWAADASNAPYGRATAVDLMRFIDHHPQDTRAILEEEGLFGTRTLAILSASSRVKTPHG
jgi:hypothetical protein